MFAWKFETRPLERNLRYDKRILFLILVIPSQGSFYKRVGWNYCEERTLWKARGSVWVHLTCDWQPLKTELFQMKAQRDGACSTLPEVPTRCFVDLFTINKWYKEWFGERKAWLQPWILLKLNNRDNFIRYYRAELQRVLKHAELHPWR